MLYKYNVNENPRYNIISVCKIYTLYIYICICFANGNCVVFWVFVNIILWEFFI